MLEHGLFKALQHAWLAPPGLCQIQLVRHLQLFAVNAVLAHGLRPCQFLAQTAMPARGQQPLVHQHPQTALFAMPARGLRPLPRLAICAVRVLTLMLDLPVAAYVVLDHIRLWGLRLVPLAWQDIGLDSPPPRVLDV